MDSKIVKNIGAYALGVGITVVGLILVGVLLNGLVWLVDKLYPAAEWIAAVGTLVLVLLLLPSSLFKRNRGWCGAGMLYVSYAWGISVWMWATLILYSLWGIVGLALGLVLLGLGSVPMAFIALLFHWEWKIIGEMLLAVIGVFGLRAFAFWVATKGEPPVEDVEYL